MHCRKKLEEYWVTYSWESNLKRINAYIRDLINDNCMSNKDIQTNI
jgi:hypothetical protein